MGWFSGDDTTEILQYTISLTDAARVAELQGNPQPGGAVGAVIMAPTVAATTYSAPINEGGTFVAPGITSAWFGGKDNFPRDVATFVRKDGGFLGISFLFGSSVTYHWRGLFKLAPSATANPIGPEPVTPLSRRRWIDGFELGVGEGGTNTGNALFCRSASRHLQGYGAKFDHYTSEVMHESTENGAATTQEQWERFYVRVRRRPIATKVRFWRCSKGPGAVIGNELAITPDGKLAMSYITGEFDIGNLLGTTSEALPLHVWVKIDVVYAYANGVSPSAPRGTFCEVFVNGKLQLSGGGGGWIANSPVFRSFMGNTSANDLTIDVDDWVGADVPVRGSQLTVYPSRDWNAGSRIGLVGARAFGSDHGAGAWTGDWRLARQRPIGHNAPQLLTGTAGGRLTLATDAAQEVDQQLNGLGIAALLVAAYANRTGATDGKLGYRLPDGTVVLPTVVQVQTPGFSWTRTLYSRTGLQPLTPLAGLELIHEATSGGAVEALAAVAEIVGLFGQEDVVAQTGVPAAATIAEKIGIHNAPYPRTPWAVRGTAPQSAVIIHTGTYVGTGTFVDLFFRVPVHFLWIRSAAGANANAVQWFSSMNAPHLGGAQSFRPECPVEILMDPDYVPGLTPTAPVQPPNIVTVVESEVRDRVRYWLKFYDVGGGLGMEAYWMGVILLAPEAGHTPGWTADSYWPDKIAIGDGVGEGYDNTTDSQEQRAIVRIVGNDAAHNALGVTYHYTAFCDPGMRFCDAGGFGIANSAGGATAFVQALDSETFTPDAAFVQQEAANIASTVGLHYKGIGHAAANISPAGGAEIDGLTVSNGTMTIRPGLLAGSLLQTAYLAFRRNDGSGDAGIPRVLQLATYTGDGSASRTIGLSPPSGRRPVFAIVVPHNAALYFRDASHIGTTSTQFPATAVPANGINGAAIDTLSVGSSLNATAVVYDVFVFPGDTVAGNGGFSIDGEFIPVAPAGLAGMSPWDPTPPDPELDDTPVDGGDGEPGTGFIGGSVADDFGEQCVGPSTIIINQALSRLGVSKKVVNILTDLTAEADAARLHYSEDVAATLRDFPWPFATRYVALTLVSGVASPDWTYAYRQPIDCVFERRIVAPRGSGVDPTPPAFQLSADNSGGLIYTNQVAAILEYTCRPPCAAGRGDALFREALVWRHALSLAPALSRMTDAAAAAEKMYEQTLAKARLVLVPGKPGLPPVAPIIDLLPTMQTANTIVVNRALVRIGAQTIASLADQSRGAQAALVLFEDELQGTLRDFPWAFATKYATLTLVTGTPLAPVNADWTYAYRVPADLLFARRLVTGAQRTPDPNPPVFKLGRDATGPVLFTHQDDAVLEYTVRLEGCVLYADSMFRDAFAWRLAASLAPSLGQQPPEQIEQLGRGPDDPTRPKERASSGVQQRAALARQAWQMYQVVLSIAERAAANEGQVDKPGECEWILGR